MIPKIIHYCWFGGSPLSDNEKRCIESWEKYCPDFEIKRWDDQNFDVMQNTYCKEAYEANKWAFVSDYARLKIIEEFGGIYLDTDIEIMKPIVPLILNNIGFLGFQNREQITTGLGFAAPSHNPCVLEMLKMYEDRHFILADGTLDLTPCPVSNTVAAKRCGLKTGKHSKKIQYLEGICILPIDYLNPMNPDTKKIKLTENCYTIHHYRASWLTEKQKNMQKLKKLIPDFVLKLRTEYISRRDICLMEKHFPK